MIEKLQNSEMCNVSGGGINKIEEEHIYNGRKVSVTKYIITNKYGEPLYETYALQRAIMVDEWLNVLGKTADKLTICRDDFLYAVLQDMCDTKTNENI